MNHLLRLPAHFCTLGRLGRSHGTWGSVRPSEIFIPDHPLSERREAASCWAVLTL